MGRMGVGGEAMRGTNNAAIVADGWDAALATILDNFSAVRIGYLDELDFALQEAIAAIPTTMVGTNSALLAANYKTLVTGYEEQNIANNARLIPTTGRVITVIGGYSNTTVLQGKDSEDNWKDMKSTEGTVLKLAVANDVMQVGAVACDGTRIGIEQSDGSSRDVGYYYFEEA